MINGFGSARGNANPPRRIIMSPRRVAPKPPTGDAGRQTAGQEDGGSHPGHLYPAQHPWPRVTPRLRQSRRRSRGAVVRLRHSYLETARYGVVTSRCCSCCLCAPYRVMPAACTTDSTGRHEQHQQAGGAWITSSVLAARDRRWTNSSLRLRLRLADQLIFSIKTTVAKTVSESFARIHNAGTTPTWCPATGQGR